MSKTKQNLNELVGGALQEQFDVSFAKVLENLQNPNAPYKNKREIVIKIGFTQNESRDDVKCEISVSEKLAPQQKLETAFGVGTDIRTGEMYCQEYGRQVPGQMSFADYEMVEEEMEEELEETAEPVTNGGILDFRRAMV